MKKLKVIIVNPVTLKLEEKGDVGDIIDLQELQKVDSTKIIETIRNAKDEIYNSLLAKEIKQQESYKQLELNQLEKNLKLEYQELMSEKERLELLVDSFDEKLSLEKSSAKVTLAANFSIEKGKLESKITELEQSIAEQKQLITLQIEQKKDAEINNIEETYKAILLEKQKQIDKLTYDLQAFMDKQNLLIEKEKGQIRSSLELSIATKESVISNLKADVEKLKSSARETILTKEAEIRVLNEQLKGKDDIKKAEIEKELVIQKQEYVNQISQKELEISQLKLAKSNLQVKMLGEELERWCNSEYETYSLSGFENCKWYKDNIIVKDSPDEKGTKADYIFEVYADDQKNANDILFSVCCEMKNESPGSKSKTKNSDHYDKLEKDRIKKNCQYSLLISELEWDTINDAPIKKIPDYENMYMVRPTYFVSFLSLIKSLANKYQALLIEHKIADKNFKDSQKIIEEFEGFKSTYLDKPLLSLQSDAEKIKAEATKAHEASYKIIGLADTIISQKLSEIKIKIERFDIKRIARKVDKINKII